MTNTSIPMKQREHLVQDAEFSRTLSQAVQFPDGTLTDMVLSGAKRYPARPAIRGPRQSDKTYREVSYAQFVQHASQISRAVNAAVADNTFADNFVGILLPRDIEYIESALGVLLTGLAYLPLYESLPPQRMQWYLEDSGARIVITSRKLEHHLTSIFSGKLIFIEDLQSSFLSARQAATAPVPSFSYLKDRVHSRNLAYMIYTSGTTGKPKGVEVEHRGACNMLHHHASVLVDEDDLKKSVLVAALIFDSSIRETWLPLVTSGCLCISDNVFGINEGSMCAGTPSGLTVATFPETLRTVMVGGERLTDGCVDNINIHHPKKILNAYGPTETTVECLIHYTDTAKRSEISWIGLPIWNTHLYGVPKDAQQDPVTGKWPLAKRGEPCELWVGGVGVARGYRNAPEKTASKFLPNTFGEEGRVYRTGDLVRWTESGDLEYLGRTDSQIKLRGYRVELEEVERVCSEAKGVGQAAIVVKKDKRGQEHLVAYITPADSSDVDTVSESQAAELKQAVLKSGEAELASYMVPSEVVVLAELPFTIGGKVDKRSLPEPDWSNSQQGGSKNGGKGDDEDEDGEVVGPSNASETSILKAVCDMLDVGTDSVSVTDNIFTDYGLTSIDAALLRRKLNKHGIEIDGTATILRHGTVRALANHILGASNGMERSILAAVCEMLDLDADTLSVDDNFFTEYGLTSIDAALLRRKLDEQGIEIDGTATILRHGTVRALAQHLNGNSANQGNSLQKEALKLSLADVTLGAEQQPNDKPLPFWLVWLITGFGFFVAAMLTYALPVAFWVIKLSAVHQWGSCDWKSDECGDAYDPWRGFAWNVLFTPLMLMGLFVLELFMVWAVKWTVVGRYRTGAYSINGSMYLRWWFVNTFMSFTYFFLLNPLRCTGLLNAWYRALGAKVGKNVVLDTACIYEADLITIGDNVTVQSDAALFGHVITRQNRVEPGSGSAHTSGPHSNSKRG